LNRLHKAGLLTPPQQKRRINLWKWYFAAYRPDLRKTAPMTVEESDILRRQIKGVTWDFDKVLDQIKAIGAMVGLVA
jgi:hypothetical protein